MNVAGFLGPEVEPVLQPARGHIVAVSSESPQRHALIMGVGNVLLGDDGVGVHAVRAMREVATQYPHVRILDAGTLGTTLLVEIEQAHHLIMIDAMRMNARPGTLHCFEGADMDRWLRRENAGSVHEVGLSELLDLARLQECLPTRRALIGIEPGTIGWGDQLSAELDGALPVIEHHVRELLRRWNHVRA